MIVLGRIAAPYGVRGRIRIQAFGDDPMAWAAMPALWVGREENWRLFRLRSLVAHGKGLLAELEGVEDRDAAEALQGEYIAAPREALPETAEDEFYWADLVGLEVRNEQGVPLGRVVDLIDSGAHAVLRLESDTGEERLLPFVAAVVKTVDRSTKSILVEWQADW